MLGVCLAGIWGGQVEAAKPFLTFIKPVTLPELGIRVNLMPDSRESPPPSPKVFTYRCLTGDLEWKEDRFEPSDLWRHAQYAGRWTGRHDNQLTLSVMASRLPTGFKDRHVTRGIYDKQVADDAARSVHSEEEAREWMADFTGCPQVEGERVKSMPARLEPVIRYRLDPLVARSAAYAFRINRPGSTTNTALWVCALVEAGLEIDMDAACKAIEKEFLPSISLVAVSQPKMQVALPLAGKAEPQQKPEDEGMASARRQVVESIRNMKGWWYEPSEHYIVLSNLKGNVKTMVGQLNRSMDAMRAAYVRCIPDNPDDSVSVIRMPATQEEYLSYVGGENAWTGGMWVPGRRELVVRPATEQGNMETRRSLFRVAFHEGFHQYAFFALNHSDPALWFNEGYAQLFENSVIMNGRVRLEESARLTGVLRQVLDGGRFDLSAFLKQSREQFYDADDEVRAANYAIAWALVYYLKKGVASETNSPFAGLLEKYVVAMRISGRSGDEATGIMLERVDVRKLAQDFERFWRSTSRQAAARRYDPFAP